MPRYRSVALATSSKHLIEKLNLIYVISVATFTCYCKNWQYNICHHYVVHFDCNYC